MKRELTDDHILIRPFSTEDTGALFEAVRESIPEVSRWLPWCHADYAIEETRAFILSREDDRQHEGEYSFAVCEAQGGRFLGGVGLNQINRLYHYCNLGYWVRTSATGRGVASRAARLAARFGLEELGLQRIEILAAVDNYPSQRVAEKAGAVREGILRQRLLVRGVPSDAALFSFVREDLNL